MKFAGFKAAGMVCSRVIGDGFGTNVEVYCPIKRPNPSQWKKLCKGLREADKKWETMNG
jgi:hypothetical protein